MQLGVKGLANGVYGYQLLFFQAAKKCFKGHFHPFHQRFKSLLEAAASMERSRLSATGKRSDINFSRPNLWAFFYILLGAAADVLRFRHGAQRLLFGLHQLVF